MKYKECEKKLGFFRFSVSTLAESLVGEEVLRNLLDRATALVLRAVIVACENQMIDRNARDSGRRMVERSQYLLELIPSHFEVLYPPDGRGHFISMITFEDLVDSYTNLYQLVENEVNIILPVVNKLCSIPLVQYFADELRLLFRQGAFSTEARSFIGCSPPRILPSKFFLKFNLIKAEIFVLELHNQKTNLMISTYDKAVSNSDASKFLSIYFNTPEVHMDERDKSIVALIEALFREEAYDQSEKFNHEGILTSLSLKIFALFKAEASLMVLHNTGTTLKFLKRYCLEILQKSLIFLRELLDQDHRELSGSIEAVVSEAINLVMSLGGGSGKMGGHETLA